MKGFLIILGVTILSYAQLIAHYNYTLNEDLNDFAFTNAKEAYIFMFA